MFGIITLNHELDKRAAKASMLILATGLFLGAFVGSIFTMMIMSLGV